MLTVFLVTACALVFGGLITAVILFDRKLRRDHQRRMDLYRPIQAQINVSQAFNKLMKYLVGQPIWFWPTAGQLLDHLSNIDLKLENPFTGSVESVLVFDDKYAASVLMAGRTIIRLIKPGLVAVETLDKSGLAVMANETLDLVSFFEFTRGIKA